LPKVSIEIGAPPQPPASTEAVRFERGQVVAGRYTVLDLVGKGGMGCIYKVRDNVLGEDVALKTLLPQFARDRVVVERFFNEAKITRRLSHPNVVRVHDIGNANGVIYISMEFLEGQSLRSAIDHAPNGHRLPLEYLYRIMDQLCASLEYAHRFTVHRDIKPENVMICSDGTVKLMDFGISKLMASQALTAASMVMGTPMYMPPEQLRDSAKVDARADIFSVGVMLYEMLTGHLPTGIPQPASQLYADIPDMLDDIVARCVAQRPENRFPDAAALRKALRAAREGHGHSLVKTQVHSRPQEAAKSGGKRRALGASLMALVLLLVAAGLVGAEQRRRTLSAAQPGPSDAGAVLQGPSWETVLAAAESNIDGSEERKKLLDEGTRIYEAATEEGRDGDAQAIPYALAAILHEEGMCFVPEGTVTLAGRSVSVPPFLIDSTEVTVGEFARFARANQWRVPVGVRGFEERFPNHPIFGVTCYDAQAYAVAADKSLPSEAQWARAAYGMDGASDRFPWGATWEQDAANVAQRGPRQGTAPVKSFEKDHSAVSGCWDFAGNVAEWTRTPARANASAPDFGTPMIVKGGSYRMQPSPLAQAQSAAYGESRDDLGFRCVREIPTQPEAIRSLLESLQ
jgi:hypothetical protein